MGKRNNSEIEDFLYKNRDFYPPDINIKYIGQNTLYSKKGAICTLDSLNSGQMVYINGKLYFACGIDKKRGRAIIRQYGNANYECCAYYNKDRNSWEIKDK